MANNIYDYDETNPFGQPQINVLRYSSQPQESTTYLVEIPEDLPELSRPPQHQTPRSRHSTIVNTAYLPETTEEDKEPLEAYIRKHLPSFRKSLTADNRILITRRMQSEKGDEGSLLVISSSRGALESDSDLGTNDVRVNGNTVAKMEEPESSGIERREEMNKNYGNVGMATQSDRENHRISDSVSSETVTQSELESCSREDMDRAQFKSDITVLQVIDHVMVNQSSPLAYEQKKANTHPKSPVKVWFLVDSDSEEDDVAKSEVRQPRDKTLKESESDRTVLDRHKDTQINKKIDYDPEKSSKFVDGTCMAKQEDDRKTGRSIKMSGARLKEPDRKDKDRLAYTGETFDSGKEDSRPKVFSSRRGIQRKPSKSQLDDKHLGEPDPVSKPTSYTGEDFDSGEEDSRPKVFSSRKGIQKKPSKSKLDDKRLGAPDPVSKPTEVSIKAPKTATQMYSMKRYHIQIPQHGQPETWYNVCFNLDSENNVDMNYDGPVKITNYYSTNKYS